MILLCKNVQQNFDYVMFTNMKKKKKPSIVGVKKRERGKE